MNPKAPNGTSRILVVDDDVRLRDLLDRYLASQGFEVRAIPDARELDKWLQRDPPSLIVLDLMLPGEDGLAVCRRLRGAGENVPIITLTCWRDSFSFMALLLGFLGEGTFPRHSSYASLSPSSTLLESIFTLIRSTNLLIRALWASNCRLRPLGTSGPKAKA